jgi:hypothetical protein
VKNSLVSQAEQYEGNHVHHLVTALQNIVNDVASINGVSAGISGSEQDGKVVFSGQVAPLTESPATPPTSPDTPPVS